MKKMSGTIILLRNLYSNNKKLFVIMILVIAAFVIAGCTTGQGGALPPSGPIGGGCG